MNCDRLDPRFKVKSVYIDSYDIDGKMQFIKFHSADQAYGKRQVVFMRGDSVGMLVILRSGGRLCSNDQASTSRGRCF